MGEGETYTFSDGDDVTEEYRDEVVPMQPKLEVTGSAGAITYVSNWGCMGEKTVRTGSESGESVDAEVRTAPTNAVITTQNVHPDGDRKLVALTFDDGPSRYTRQYLDILAEHGAVATFFELGSNVSSSPSVAAEVVAAGSQVASHSYSHPQLTSVSAEAVHEELSSSIKAISDATGTTTTMFRPPYGDFRAETWTMTQGVVSLSVLWNEDSRDWQRPGVDAIVANATDGVRPGSIILMHDGGGNRDQDLEALPLIIDRLKADGYTFVTISQLMASDSSIPQAVTSGDATPPAGVVWPTELA